MDTSPRCNIFERKTNIRCTYDFLTIISWPGENSHLRIICLSGNLVINLKPGFLNSSTIDTLDRIHFWLWGLFLCIVEYSTYISGLFLADASSTIIIPYLVGKTKHSPNIAKFSLRGSCSRLKTTGLKIKRIVALASVHLGVANSILGQISYEHIIILCQLYVLYTLYLHLWFVFSPFYNNDAYNITPLVMPPKYLKMKQLRTKNYIKFI